MVQKEVVTLTAEQYQRLVKRLGNTAMTDSTTALNAAYKLGIQHTLAAIREGFVVGEVVEKPSLWQRIKRMWEAV